MQDTNGQFQMPVDIRFEIHVRSCGCIGVGAYQHWWKYNRFRLAWRILKGCVHYWRICFRAMRLRAVASFVESNIPLLVGLGLLPPSEGHSGYRAVEKFRDNVNDWEKGELFLGADSDNPDGEYAECGRDMALMAEDEWWHWYGRKRV
jgi:hypothetical protein